LISKNFWTGVGTGDIEDKLIKQYTQMGSELKAKFRFHAHNQFLAIFITFGVIGFLWFVFALIYPAVKLKGFNSYFFVSFFLIIVLSMFSDDTIETQAGATLFAFFYSFLLLGKDLENRKARN
jgi:O-antigen ligase